MQPRCSRGAAEVQWRWSRGARGAAEVQPRCSRGRHRSPCEAAARRVLPTRACLREPRQDQADLPRAGAAHAGRPPTAQVLHALRGPVLVQVPAQLGVDRLREQVQVPAALWLGCHLRAGVQRLVSANLEESRLISSSLAGACRTGCSTRSSTSTDCCPACTTCRRPLQTTCPPWEGKPR